MNIKGKILLVCASAALAGCLSVPVAGGNTVTSPQLRADVRDTVLKVFRMQTDCHRAEKIVPQVQDVRHQGGRVESVKELWTVYGCGLQETYPVVMRPDAKGETDYTVSSRMW